MRYTMEGSDFCFDEGQEPLLPGLTVMPSGEFLRMAEELDEDGVERLFQTIEDNGTILDISDLPRLGATGQAALRLREETELAQQNRLPEGLDKGDALRIYLEELAAQPEPVDPKETLLITGMKRTVELAKEYTGYGVLLLDLIQEGNIGLWQSMSAYTGGSFTRFIEENIRQAMIRAILRQTIASGLSRKLRQAVEDYRTADERLLMELGRNPTPEEMAEHLHMTVEEVEAVRRTLENARMVDKAHIQPEPEEEEAEEAQAVEDTAYYQTREKVSDLMSGLTALETELLNLRYGLNGKPSLSLQETAQRLNMTTTQVTEAEQTALAKMRGAQ